MLAVASWVPACEPGGSAPRSVVAATIPHEIEEAIVALLRPPPAIGRAERTLVERCMAREGLSFPPARVSVPARAPVSFSSLIGLLSPADAAREGYGWAIIESRVEPGPRSGPTEDEYLRSLPASERKRYWIALFGRSGDPQVDVPIPGTPRIASTSTTGCWSDARRRLFGDLRVWLRGAFYPQILLEARADLMESRALRWPTATYEACMRSAGYEVAQPAETLELARDLFGSRHGHDPPSLPELAMAKQDATCQTSAGLRVAIEREIQERTSSWFTLHAQALARLADRQSDTLAKARGVLASSAVPI